MYQTLKVGVLIFPNAEILDFAGPYEVFSVANRLQEKSASYSPFQVMTVALEKTVIARHGLQVTAFKTFSDNPSFDIFIISGGVMDQPLNDQQTLEWVQHVSKESIITASVCTGAFVLAKLGLLNQKKATTHWEDIAEFRSTFPDIEVLEDVSFVDEGKIITSAGISAGIDMSLHIVERILGNVIAEATARQMQYSRQKL